MEELTTQGIVLRAIDYGEKDKIITIFTADKGRVSAILKGVRRITSRLKYVSQPFCYADFKLTGRSELMTVSNASEITNFFDITQSYAKMVCGSAILEMVDNASTIGQSDPILFDALRRCLGLLADSDINPDLILMRFAIGLFKVSGYAMNLKTCRICGKSINEDMVVYDLETGEFCCYKCPVPKYITVSPRAVEIMQKISKIPVSALEDIFIMENEAREFRQIVKANFALRFGWELRSLSTSFD
mgnify:FL=1